MGREQLGGHRRNESKFILSAERVAEDRYKRFQAAGNASAVSRDGVKSWKFSLRGQQQTNRRVGRKAKGSAKGANRRR